MDFIEISHKEGYTELAFSGKIAGTAIAKMMKQLEPFEFLGDVVINMGNVEIIDSIGIGLCMMIFNELDKKGKKLRITNMPNDMYELFEFMNIQNHFTIEKK